MTQTPFSDQYGDTRIRSLIQLDDLDRATRVAIWNELFPAMKDSEYGYFPDSNETRLRDTSSRLVWCKAFGQSTDEMPSVDKVWAQIKSAVLDGPMNSMFDIIQILLPGLRFDLPAQLTKQLNEVFERYLVGYRIVNARILKVDSAVESEALMLTLTAASQTGLEGVFRHVEKSITLLSERDEPDYPNTIKEAMSGVEAMCEFITGKNQLGDALKDFHNSGVIVPGVQIEAWKKMYGWASGENGVRHGSLKLSNVDHAIAKYAVVTGASFVSLLIEKAREAGKFDSAVPDTA